jgi:hypothetical protein
MGPLSCAACGVQRRHRAATGADATIRATPLGQGVTYLPVATTELLTE